jgi:hypothetical protein
VTGKKRSHGAGVNRLQHIIVIKTLINLLGHGKCFALSDQSMDWNMGLEY